MVSCLMRKARRRYVGIRRPNEARRLGASDHDVSSLVREAFRHRRQNRGDTHRAEAAHDDLPPRHQAAAGRTAVLGPVTAQGHSLNSRAQDTFPH